MRIDLDRDRCEGHGVCEAQAPGLLQLDDDGYPAFADADVPAAHEAGARAAVTACPVAALHLRP